MVLLSTLLATAVFTHCTPNRSIWDPRLAAERVCHLNFIILAKVACGMHLDPRRCNSEANKSVRMGCCYGFFPSVAALVSSMECEHEAEGQDHCLHVLESRRFVRPQNQKFLFYLRSD